VVKKPEDIARKAADFLKDETVHADVRSGAAYALGNLEEAAQPYIKDILDIIKDETVHAWIRGSTVYALGNLGEATQPYIKDIANIIKDETVHAWVHSGAVYALGNLGEAAVPYIPDLLNFLKDEKAEAENRFFVANAWSNIRKLELNEVVVVLEGAYELDNRDVNFEQWRFLTYFLSGGTDEVKTLFKWVGNPKELPTQLTYEQGKKTLKVFRDAWAGSERLKRLRTDLANKIADVARRISWKSQDIPLLQTHYDNLKKGGYNQADAVQLAIDDVS
jgi:HEAT repeat protein